MKFDYPSRVIALTAFDRVGYLRETLESWSHVRGIDNWLFFATVDPSPRTQDIVDLLAQFYSDNGIAYSMTTVNPEQYGVLRHPWMTFEHLFSHGADFVVRVEDDLPVSTDFLEYMSWADSKYQADKDVAAVIGYTDNAEGEPDEVTLENRFSPWNWGTWKDRWDEYIGPTWDHDYSTHNGTPGQQAGWDWNLNTRVLPELGKKCVFPKLSRVQNIGQVGTHAQAHEFPQSPSFQPHYLPQEYRQVR